MENYGLIGMKEDGILYKISDDGAGTSNAEHQVDVGHAAHIPEGEQQLLQILEHEENYGNDDDSMEENYSEEDLDTDLHL
ncbi:unnamed protein product [Meloidogyne enterolobii]|uniref:Uncharacterized protein n=1 Tax=Meloidogyne enterolobii TaxID=390850 RepID=A0ACB0YAN5_MELEN